LLIFIFPSTAANWLGKLSPVLLATLLGLFRTWRAFPRCVSFAFSSGAIPPKVVQFLGVIECRGWHALFSGEAFLPPWLQVVAPPEFP